MVESISLYHHRCVIILIMSLKKENLLKLFDFIQEVSELKGNEWFKDKLTNKYSAHNASADINDPAIAKIYEYCIKEIIQKQAETFYKDFKLLTIKHQLVSDFVRMEHFRRDDNFEDFCLAIHQQLEAIINYLCTDKLDFCNRIILDKNKSCYKIKNKEKNFWEEFKLWQLIISTYKTQLDADKLFNQQLIMWEYPLKLKAVIYYYCFSQKIWDFYKFKEYNDLANEVYQSRNLNHRGGFQYETQKQLTDKIKNESHKYYFKFLGFLEDFTSKINSVL